MAIRIAVVGMGARGQDWVREIQKNDHYELSAAVEVDGRMQPSPLLSE